MRRSITQFSLLATSAITLSLVIAALAPAQQVRAVSPKPSKTYISSGPTYNAPASYQATTKYSPGVVQAAPSMQASSSGGVSNVLATLNSQRARQGVGQLVGDPQLQAVAQRRAAMMARSGNKSHPPGSFSPGRYEGVGWSSSYSPTAVSACFTSDSRMRYAGAAMARGRDGVYFAVVYR